MPQLSPRGARPFQKHFIPILAGVLILTGILLRVDWMNRTALWCDEAESSINALTILERGFPMSEYLGIPIYENTLTEPWVGHPEYEFRDSSYSPQGLAVYHGWIPLYAIAASQALFGLRPDHPVDPPIVRHGAAEIALRTMAPRIPSILFSALCMFLIYLLGCDLGGRTAGIAALALMAFNAKTVDFGYQARYYSLTLLMTVFAAWCLVRMLRLGRWQDFLLVGLAVALLFHTHQLSALIFAATALVTVPAVIRLKGWFLKSLGAASLAAGLVLPWIRFSGFLSTASSVPKANKLFDSFSDWMAYTQNRPDQLAILAVLVLVLLAGKLRPAWFPVRLQDIVREHGKIYFALMAWLVIGYAAFHLIVPAASFFFERLSLVLWVPYVLVLALLTSDILKRFSAPWAAVLAVIAVACFLSLRGRLAFFEGPSVTGSRTAIAAVIAALQASPLRAGTRLYATPNEHLTYTYYTGLPVQSVAPVRKSFFEACRNPLVFIESQMDWIPPGGEDVRIAASAAGAQISTREADNLSALVWTHIVAEELAQEGIPIPPLPPFPDFLNPVAGNMRMQMLKFRENYMNDVKATPIFRGISATRVKDFWLGFFYRFVTPGDRTGNNMNIFPRLQKAKVEFLPSADVVIYRIDP